MKSFSLLQLAALSTAFVLPGEQVYNLQHVQLEPRPAASSGNGWLPSKEDVVGQIKHAFDDVHDRADEIFDDMSAKTEQTWEHAVSYAEDSAGEAYDHLTEKSKYAWDNAYSYAQDSLDPSDDLFRYGHAGQGWLDCAADEAAAWADRTQADFEDTFGGHHGGHHGRHGHHGDHGSHGKSNLTVYQLIAKSNYTTKLAELINEYPDLVKALNGTTANFTVFAPTDRAFAKIPKHAPKPSKEQLEEILSYHVSPEFYPAGRILVTRTIPTLYQSKDLGAGNKQQRLSTNIGFKGLTVNFYSRVIAANIFGSNGVIHGVDSILVPPPSKLKIIDLLPSEFSTLELGLVKTGLFEALNETKKEGGTFFAPSNYAFSKLGPRINAFLFSDYGRRYLKALLKYHVVPKKTLYSDAYYNGTTKKADEEGAEGVPKGFFSVDLPTLLEDAKLGINIFRYGRLIDIKINGYYRVAVADGVASDGVVHVVSDVLIPPKKLPSGELVQWDPARQSEGELVMHLTQFMDEPAPTPPTDE